MSMGCSLFSHVFCQSQLEQCTPLPCWHADVLHVHLNTSSTYIKYLVLLPLVDLASQAAVGQRVLDDVLVGLGAGLLV